MELESKSLLFALVWGEVKSPIWESSLGKKLESRNRLGARVDGGAKDPVWSLGKKVIY
jgi:hypothetical protein